MRTCSKLEDYRGWRNWKVHVTFIGKGKDCLRKKDILWNFCMYWKFGALNIVVNLLRGYGPSGSLSLELLSPKANLNVLNDDTVIPCIRSFPIFALCKTLVLITQPISPFLPKGVLRVPQERFSVWKWLYPFI